MFKKHWFRNKTYGYGWYPATIEGWITLCVYLLFIFTISLFFVTVYDGSNIATLIFYILAMVLATITFLFICVKTGDKLGWHWGKK